MITLPKLLAKIRNYKPNFDEALVKKAYLFAKESHGSQKRHSGDIYFSHPVEVAEIITNLKLDEESIATALLHDVVEDTGCTFTDIHMAFGIDIPTLVGWLTDVSQPHDGNRAHRKAVDRAHTAEAPAEAQTIKLADLISNSKSIMEHDPTFAKTYLEEKRLLLAVMTKGDPGLHAEASKYVGA